MKNTLSYQSLKSFNLKMGILHLVQGLIMLYCSLEINTFASFKIPINYYFLAFDNIKMDLVVNSKEIYQLPFGIFVSLFLLISALFHFIIISKKGNEIYNKNLAKNINIFRWYEYAISSSIMIVLIAMLFGVYDIGTIILIFSLNASMNLFGLLMEKLNKAENKVSWSPFVFGSFAGFIPWIVILIYGFGNTQPELVPKFVYILFATYFIFFNLFPINMILQYKKVGKWSNYLYGERIYIILSLVAKSILAWLTLFGVMQP